MSLMLGTYIDRLFSLQDHMPLPPEGEGESPKLQFSIVESVLFAFHQLGRKVGSPHWDDHLTGKVTPLG